MQTLIIAALCAVVGYLIGKRSVESELDECFRHYFHHFFEHYIGAPPGVRKTVTETGQRKATTNTRNTPSDVEEVTDNGLHN
jgi:hypothetical protein